MKLSTITLLVLEEHLEDTKHAQQKAETNEERWVYAQKIEHLQYDIQRIKAYGTY